MKQLFPDARIKLGEAVDLTEARAHERSIFITLVPEDEVPKNRYRIEFDLPLPGIGGMVRKGKKVSKILKKADDAVKKVRKLAEPVFKTDAEAAKKAKELGFERINETVMGAAVFKKGNQYITRDRMGHKGGAWKVANSVEELRSKTTRSGTYDENLTKRVDN